MKIWAESGQHVPVHVWASRVDAVSKQRLQRLARWDRFAGPIVVLPDVHAAGDVCVGTVLVTKEVVLPTAVGEDLGCGMAVRKFEFDATVLSHDDLERMLAELQAVIPVGRRTHATPQEIPETLKTEPLSTPVLAHERSFLAPRHFGTLGGGNHFVELQRDGGGALWATVHSGSRGIGACIAHFHAKRCRQESKRAGLPWMNEETSEAAAFWMDFNWALAFAAANRTAMLEQVTQVLVRFTGQHVNHTDMLNVAHNTITREVHAGRERVVHRKGAMGLNAGECGIIPGSMGTSSYLVEGLGSAATYGSCSHGAGRICSREEARRRISVAQLRRELGSVVYPQQLERELVEEAPSAYKPIKEVLKEQSDLVVPLLQLKPLMVLKG